MLNVRERRLYLFLNDIMRLLMLLLRRHLLVLLRQIPLVQIGNVAQTIKQLQKQGLLGNGGPYGR